MGKKKEKLSNESPRLSEKPFSQEILSSKAAVAQNGSKKSKKHKRKKSYKKEKHLELKLLSSTNSQIGLGETLIVEDLTMGIDQEITVDDVEMVVEDAMPKEFSDIFLKSADSIMDKNKVMQKIKVEKIRQSGKKNRKKDGSKGDDDTDSEEERWLDAIESGKLEEVDDELKRMKNPQLMTARQRALMEKRCDGVDEGFGTIPAEPLLALPSGFKEKVLTEEMLAKKAIKSKRRREQAQEKREEDKKKTVDRLLKKQDSKIPKGGRLKNLKNIVPLLTYIDNKDGIYLSLPLGMEFPIEAQIDSCPPKPKVCGIDGCYNLKKYSCSKSNMPLCSLQCYKINMAKLASHQAIT